MELPYSFSIFIGTLLSIMLSIIAWFIRELHHDFRTMKKEVSSLQHTANMIQTEAKSSSELIKLQVGFLQWRIEDYERTIGKNFKKSNHEKSN